MPHDDSKTCEKLFGDLGGHYLMAPLFVSLNKSAPWSPCSSLYITEFFGNGHGEWCCGSGLCLRAENVCQLGHRLWFSYGADSGFRMFCSHEWCLSCLNMPLPPKLQVLVIVYLARAFHILFSPFWVSGFFFTESPSPVLPLLYCVMCFGLFMSLLDQLVNLSFHWVMAWTPSCSPPQQPNATAGAEKNCSLSDGKHL